MWDLVGNPEDRFSHNEAHIVMTKSSRKDVADARIDRGAS